ncbi:MAG: hypothetical protein LUG17_02960, partial [Clostridiales bacterium]|nr:hypothetical protein [Clostridiales bacterium]
NVSQEGVQMVFSLRIFLTERFYGGTINVDCFEKQAALILGRGRLGFNGFALRGTVRAGRFFVAHRENPRLRFSCGRTPRPFPCGDPTFQLCKTTQADSKSITGGVQNLCCKR